jgi:hypothetical protein
MVCPSRESGDLHFMLLFGTMEVEILGIEI